MEVPSESSSRNLSLVFRLKQVAKFLSVLARTVRLRMDSGGVSLQDRYRAAMVLAGVGDAMGYRNGSWEFNMSGNLR